MTFSRIVVITAALALALCAFGQDYTPAQFGIQGSLGFNHSDTPQFQGFGMFEKSTSQNTSVIGIANLGAKQAAISPGVKQYFYHAGNFHLFGLTAVGAAMQSTSTGTTTGLVLSAGGGLDVEFPQLLTSAAPAKIPSSIVPYISTIVGLEEIPNQGPSFLYMAGIGIKFK